MTAMTANGVGVYATCPGCEEREELLGVPQKGDAWPICESVLSR
jgi:hypothetical protein